MKQYFDAKDHINYKTGDEVVTIADKEINQLVIDEVAKHFPDHGVLGEEGDSDTKTAKFMRITDPIDGTLQYSRRIPVSVFSLALMEDGYPIVGCIYQPQLDEFYYARRGEGAFLNDMPIHVSTKQLRDRGALVGNCIWKRDEFAIKPLYDQLFEESIITIDL